MALGAGMLGSRCSEHGLSRGGAPGGYTPLSSLAACTWGWGWGWGGGVECNHRMTRAGPLNQCFSNCTVTRIHLRSGDSESVGLG